MSAATTSTPSAPRMDFCRRCGDPVSSMSAGNASRHELSRCRKCGGTATQAKVRESEPAEGSKSRKDPWERSYVSGSLKLADSDEQFSLAFPSSTPAPTLARAPVSRNAPLALGVPSSISRDLRTPPPPQRPRLSSDAAMPTIQAPDGQLSKVVGTLLAPEEQRKTWKCGGCEAPFVRDATLFAAPTAATLASTSTGATTPRSANAASSGTSTPSQFFCQACYSQRFSLGVCPGCKKAVLGLVKEEGRFVRAGDDVWHGKCWVCGSCGTKDRVIRGMDAMPVCEECFDQPKPRRAPAVSMGASTGAAHNFPVPTTRRQSQDLRNLSGAPAARTAMGASIAALSARFSGTSIAPAAANVPPSPQLGPVRSGSASPTKMGPPPTWGNTAAYGNNAPYSRSRTMSALAGASSSGLDKKQSGQTPSSTAMPTSTSLASLRSDSGSLSRSNSITRSLSRTNSLSRPGSPTKPRPLTAQFTGEKFDLAAFRSSQAGAQGSNGLTRQDSRNGKMDRNDGASSPGNEPPTTQVPRTRSGFPLPAGSSKREEPVGESAAKPGSAGQEEVTCAACGRPPFFEEAGNSHMTVEMVTLSSSGLTLHAHCFRCATCGEQIDGSRSFVRLEDDEDPAMRKHLPRYAHPPCAPVPKMYPVKVNLNGATDAAAPTTMAHASEPHHVTHQSVPRPSLGPNPPPPAQKYGFISSASSRSRSTSPSKASFGMDRHASNDSSTDANLQGEGRRLSNTGLHASGRRFQPTSGAAPPTRSTLDVQPPSSRARDMRGIFSGAASSRAPASTSLAKDGSVGGSQQTFPAAASITFAGRKLGGLLQCAGCSVGLTSLESVPGPRGTSWHRGCLRCGGIREGASTASRRSSLQITSRANLFESSTGKSSASEGKRCGKLLDSAAKVNAEGQVRCSECWSARL
ncbi:hypothetical protein IE81DRAFT_319811 [Ceraceosorus guamensis]|uniref:LIM zinc-binding domain-containing protein n=1 Tax=Ceraceosorus guamensis TaxID=1522189 RepID=A0A316WB97_9BASI|nr:hypothetical protein IE81DRAFT_319811 [Ceraceosorus guamensis]PWN45961.1 hypothetical protein IE81DRAFT_319811 [Ceraceosorus guamensis]